MTSNSKYSHIKSFKDFEEEKIRIHHQISISRKKLQIKRLEYKEASKPLRLIKLLFNGFSRPAFSISKMAMMFILKRIQRRRQEKKAYKKAERKYRKKHAG